MITLILKAIANTCGVKVAGSLYYSKDRTDILIGEALEELEKLDLFKSEHLWLEAELNAILHPNGDGPTAPSFCDLVSYVRKDITPKTCDWTDGHVSGCGIELSKSWGTFDFCPYCGGEIVVNL